MADNYQGYFWKWVTVKGYGIATPNTYSLKLVTEIAEEETISFDKIGEYHLKKSITLKTTYRIKV